MARNQKLTGVIAGRSIVRVERGVERGEEEVRVVFDDGSVMTVRVAPGQEVAAVTGRVRAVRQSGTRLRLDLTDGRTLDLATAEPASSVILRARDGTLEYAD